MILITGASGELGRPTARRLLASGQRVRVLGRDPEKLADLAAAGAEVVRGDLREQATLARACAGADAVLAAATAFGETRGNLAPAVDDLGNRNLVDAARVAGVTHFVFTSIHGAGPTHPVDVFRYKYRVEEYLRASGLGYTTLRPTAYMEKFVPLMGDAIVRGGKVMIFGRGVNPINFVSAQDVAQVAARVLCEPGARGRTIEVCGPENLSMLQFADILDRALGRHSSRQYIPRAMLRLMGVAARPFNPLVARLAASGYWMDTTDQTCDPGALLAEFPMEQTTVAQLAQRLYGAAARAVAGR